MRLRSRGRSIAQRVHPDSTWLRRRQVSRVTWRQLRHNVRRLPKRGWSNVTLTCVTSCVQNDVYTLNTDILDSESFSHLNSSAPAMLCVPRSNWTEAPAMKPGSHWERHASCPTEHRVSTDCERQDKSSLACLENLAGFLVQRCTLASAVCAGLHCDMQ